MKGELEVTCASYLDRTMNKLFNKVTLAFGSSQIC